MTISRTQLDDNRLVTELYEGMKQETGCRIKLDEPLSRHTAFRVGGPARFYAWPKNEFELGGLVQFCNQNEIRTFLIGYGTNLLVSDNGYAGCIIDLSDGFRDYKIQGTHVRTGSGAWLSDVVKAVAAQGLSGMENLAGIPGGVGGGLSMNCGAFRGSISDHLLSVEVMNYEGEAYEMLPKEICFAYRQAPGLSDKIVLFAEFDLSLSNVKEVLAATEETITERFRRNVMTLPSAGSVFKNPEGNFSAKLIESVGGKGMSYGGAEVSQLHANFIVNARGGTAADIVTLIEMVRDKVYKEHEILLEMEVRRLGFDYED
ncbi:UDP-N-acetylmuramate dehydrogenase [Calditrichota bacterium]